MTSFAMPTMPTHTPPSLTELKSLRQPVRNVHRAYRERLGRGERVALWATERVGAFGFFLLVLTWTACWLAWNTFAPPSFRFDPFPAFVLWLFISNCIQLLLLPLILIGQNLETRRAETRAEAEFELNVKAEREIEVVLQHLENQNELILEVLKRIERR